MSVIQQTDDSMSSNKELHIGTANSLLYYSDMQVFKNIEPALQENRFIQAFSTLALGSTGVLLNINPNPSEFVGETFIRISLPAVPVNVSLPRGWGYSLLRFLRYRLNSSSTYEFSGPQNLLQTLSSCETMEKRLQMLTLGGQEIFNGSGGQPIEAIVFLNLPFSRARHASHRRFFPSGLLSGPVQVEIAFNTLDTVSSGTGATAYNLATQNFTVGEFHVSVIRLQDLNLSIAPQMSANPSLFYLYPFIYSQSFSTTPFAGRVSPNRCLISLTGFQQGILTSILFYVVRQDDISGAVANGAKNAFSIGQRLRDVRLSFNSQTLFDKPGTSADALLTITSMNPNYYPASQLNTSQTTSPFNAIPVNSFFYETKMSPLNISPKEIESSLIGGLENVSNISLQLEFSTIDTAQYQIFAIYNYDAGAKISGGQCSYIF